MEPENKIKLNLQAGGLNYVDISKVGLYYEQHIAEQSVTYTVVDSKESWNTRTKIGGDA